MLEKPAVTRRDRILRPGVSALKIMRYEKDHRRRVQHLADHIHDFIAVPSAIPQSVWTEYAMRKRDLRSLRLYVESGWPSKQDREHLWETHPTNEQIYSAYLNSWPYEQKLLGLNCGLTAHELQAPTAPDMTELQFLTALAGTTVTFMPDCADTPTGCRCKTVEERRYA